MRLARDLPARILSRIDHPPPRTAGLPDPKTTAPNTENGADDRAALSEDPKDNGLEQRSRKRIQGFR